MRCLLLYLWHVTVRKNLPSVKVRNRVDGGSSFYCIWFLRTGAYGSADPRCIRRNGNKLAGGFSASGDHDPAYDHRAYRVRSQKCAGKLLRGLAGAGSNKERSIFCVILPAAKSGILAAVVLGIGRAIGETMAVIMVAGNQARMPEGILKGLRTMTANIVTEMGYATGLHREALIATGVVLFVFILIINLCLSLLNRRAENAN